MKRTPLRRVPWRRRAREKPDPSEYQAFWRTVTASGKAACWLAKYSDRPCQSSLDAAHLIPKQRIRREGFPEAEVYDPATGIPACRLHHTLFDARALKVPRADLPGAVEAWAETHNMVWSLDHDYGREDVEWKQISPSKT